MVFIPAEHRIHCSPVSQLSRAGSEADMAKKLKEVLLQRMQLHTTSPQQQHWPKELLVVDPCPDEVTQLSCDAIQ